MPLLELAVKQFASIVSMTNDTRFAYSLLRTESMYLLVQYT